MTLVLEQVTPENNDIPEFAIKVSETTELKTFFGLAQCLSEELTISITSDTLSFKTLDPSQVAMLDVKWNSACFEKYEVTKEGVFAIRTDEFYKLIKTFAKKDSVELSINDSCLLTLKTKTSEQKIRLIESSVKETPIPKLSYDTHVKFYSVKFVKDLIKRIEIVSEYLTLESNNQKLFLTGIGDRGDAKITLERGMAEIPEMEIKEESKSTYSIEYVKELLKHLDNKSQLSIYYSTKLPIRIEARPTNGFNIDYYLAPRIED